MENPLRQSWTPYALLALAAVAVGAVFFLVATRGGGNLDPQQKQNLREKIEASVTQQMAALLQVSEDEAEQLYEDKELEEAAREVGLDSQDLLRSAQSAARVILEDAVDRGELNEKEVEKTEQLVLRAVRRHL